MTKTVTPDGDAGQSVAVAVNQVDRGLRVNPLSAEDCGGRSPRHDRLAP